LTISSFDRNPFNSVYIAKAIDVAPLDDVLLRIRNIGMILGMEIRDRSFVRRRTALDRIRSKAAGAQHQCTIAKYEEHFLDLISYLYLWGRPSQAERAAKKPILFLL
jgi:hypothetical protein